MEGTWVSCQPQILRDDHCHCAWRRRPSESAWLHDRVPLGAPRRCKGLMKKGKLPGKPW